MTHPAEMFEGPAETEFSGHVAELFEGPALSKAAAKAARASARQEWAETAHVAELFEGPELVGELT